METEKAVDSEGPEDVLNLWNLSIGVNGRQERTWLNSEAHSLNPVNLPAFRSTLCKRGQVCLPLGKKSVCVECNLSLGAVWINNKTNTISGNFL